MTVTAAEARIEYAGNGSVLVFAYPYQFFQNDDLDVWLFDDSTGVGVEQVLGVNYTVTGAMNPSGGNVAMMVAPPAGTTLIIINNPDIVQTTHYVNADDFPADSHEQALDRLTKICQRLSDRVDRAVRAPDYSPEDQVPDAETLVNLVEDAQQAADNAETSAGNAATSAAAAGSSATEAITAANAATASATAAATSANSAQSAANASAASAAAAQVSKIVWRGAWSSVTGYVANDAVQVGGSSYISKTSNTNKNPPANAADWDLMAQKGADGTGGGGGGGDMLRANNLSDVVSIASSRDNLGLKGAAILDVGTTAGTVAAGDDARLAAVALKAPLASPNFTGNPTAPTQSPGDNDTSVATTQFVTAAVAAGVASVTPPVAATAVEYTANSAPTKMLTPGAAWGSVAAATLIADGATLTMDCNAGIDFYVLPGAGRTMANPTNQKVGQRGLLFIIQTTGTGTITTWGSNWKFPGGVKPVLTAAANAVDILSYYVGSGGIYCTAGLDFK